MKKEMPHIIYASPWPYNEWHESEKMSKYHTELAQIDSGTRYVREDLTIKAVKNLNEVNLDFGIVRNCIDGKREPFEGIAALERIAMFINRTRSFEKIKE